MGEINWWEWMWWRLKIGELGWALFLWGNYYKNGDEFWKARHREFARLSEYEIEKLLEEKSNG